MSDINKEINSLIPDDLKQKFKTLFQKFNIGTPPVVPPAAAVPPVPPIPAQSAHPVQLQETTLQDGTVIKYDTQQLAQGSIVTIVTPEGEMNAPEGEHTLADGTKIKVVSKDGKSVVESITPGQQAPPQAPGVMTEQIVSQMRADFEQKFKAVNDEKETFKTQLTKVETDHRELTGKFNDLMVFLSQVMELPTAKPVESPKNKFESGINKKASILSQYSQKK